MSASHTREVSDRQKTMTSLVKGRRKAGVLTWLQSLWRATLIVVAVGVALMHTTGHACNIDTCPSETAAVAELGAHDVAFDHEGGGHQHHPPSTGMNPMQICLAILSGLALAVALWAIWRLVRLTADSRSAVRVRAAWDLPVSLPSGGRLSHLELSVLRI